MVDDVLKVFLPLIESRGEHKIACGAGCNACCNNFVRCSLPEALLVADWLKQPENAVVLERFRNKMPAWRERAGETAHILEEILERSGGTQPEGAEWERFKEIGTEYALRGNLCPFNEDGRCEVYPVRPTICRAVHVLETSHYCTPGRGQHPKVVSHPKMEEVVQDATMIFSRAAAGLVGSGRERALPESVAWALENG